MTTQATAMDISDAAGVFAAMLISAVNDAPTNVVRFDIVPIMSSLIGIEPGKTSTEEVEEFLQEINLRFIETWHDNPNTTASYVVTRDNCLHEPFGAIFCLALLSPPEISESTSSLMSRICYHKFVLATAS